MRHQIDKREHSRAGGKRLIDHYAVPILVSETQQGMAVRSYSAFNILREGLRGHAGWSAAWRSPDPKPAYDILVIGGGNTGRDTTVIRSNYFYPESTVFYDLSVRLYKGLSRKLN